MQRNRFYNGIVSEIKLLGLNQKKITSLYTYTPY